MADDENEWCVTYNGIGDGQKPEMVKGITGKIIKTVFKPVKRQFYSNFPDKYPKGEKVGDSVAEEDASISEINGRKYLTVLMIRVKPDAIRNCDECSDSCNDKYWVINWTTDEIRPYRILYKEII